MTTVSMQDRTPEFRSILAQSQKQKRQRVANPGAPQQQSRQSRQSRQSLGEAEWQKGPAHGSSSPGPSAGSEFARNAAQIGRGITATMGKLQRLAQLARRKAIFDDRPVEISELTYVIKQDLAALNQQICSLQVLTQAQHPTASNPRSPDHEGQHHKTVVLMLQNKVTDVAANFKDVLETRTKNMQASRSRTENFVSSVSARSHAAQLHGSRSESPLYQTAAASSDLLTLEAPSAGGGGSSGSSGGSGGSGGSSSNNLAPDAQLLLMEEAQPANTYIQERGQAIEAIEKTINELGSIFAQLAGMVQEQGDMLQRIDAHTEDVVDNVQGAQRELLKYWNRVQGNRMLVAKMFGVLMVFFLIWVLIAG